jgi:hypothetical protein
MQLVQASDAILLSGLTADQLREWCGRRAVVVPDVPAAGRGRHALYSWQTIMALRLLKELHGRFRVEVGSWAGAIGQCRDLLRGRSFPSLWGTSAAFLSTGQAVLIAGASDVGDGPRLLVPLDPHLEVLASGLDLPGPASQLPLFTALRVGR